MLEKIAQIVGKMSGIVIIAAALAIVIAVFVVGLLFSFGGELGKFKKGAKTAIKGGTLAAFQASAKELMPLRVRKQYKAYKQNGGKPDDHITSDTCVYTPFKEGIASHLPGMVMAAGLLSVLLSFFLAGVVSGTAKYTSEKFPGGLMYVVPAVVTVAVMILRLAAGLISTAVLKGGIKTYNAYIDALASCMAGGQISHDMPEDPVVDIPPTTTVDEPKTMTYDPTFGEPERINVELADDEETQTVYMQPESVTNEPVTESEPIVMASPASEPVMSVKTETDEEIRARARAEALAKLRAEQAQRQAAKGDTPPTTTIPRTISRTTERKPATAGAAAEEVFARIDQISREGAPIATMKEVAMQLQKERGKPENSAPEVQQRFKEALATLLKAMSTASKK